MLVFIFVWSSNSMDFEWHLNTELNLSFQMIMLLAWPSEVWAKSPVLRRLLIILKFVFCNIYLTLSSFWSNNPRRAPATTSLSSLSKLWTIFRGRVTKRNGLKHTSSLFHSFCASCHHLQPYYFVHLRYLNNGFIQY